MMWWGVVTEAIVQILNKMEVRTLMGRETERKFLVTDSSYKTDTDLGYVRQGFLNATPERTVRVRVVQQPGSSEGYAALTIKGKGTISRQEFEYRIPMEDGLQLLHLCEPGIIEKTRYFFHGADGHEWEVDEFAGPNAGLVVAEIELRSEDQGFVKPEWVGEEVTGVPRYYNSAISLRPYSSWDADER